MPKSFFFFAGLKTGAFVMAFINLLGGASLVISSIVKLHFSNNEGDTTVFIVCIVIGFITITNGVLLLADLIQDKERFLLVYLIVGSCVLFAMFIYSLINLLAEDSWPGLIITFPLSIILAYGQYCVCSFYEEVCVLPRNKIEVESSYDPQPQINQAYLNDGASVENTNF